VYHHVVILQQVNQIGSVTESINAVKLAKKNGWGVMTSHRSGECMPPLRRLSLLSACWVTI
jgi:enolase